jgi:hypothetical protein
VLARRAEAPAPTPRIGRALLIGWAASIVVVAIVVGALVFGLASLRPVSAVTGARQVASLDEPTTDPPTAMPWSANGRPAYASRARHRRPPTSARRSGERHRAPGSRTPRIADRHQRLRAGPSTRLSPAVDRDSPEELRLPSPSARRSSSWDGTAVAVFAADPPAPTSAPA